MAKSLCFLQSYLHLLPTRPHHSYGLRNDFQGELFTGSKYLLTWGDKLVELKTICHCGRKANMVIRVDESGYALAEGEQVSIGGNESYVSVCRVHYKGKRSINQ